MAVELLKPIHPGEVLCEEFLRPFGLSVEKLAAETHIETDRIMKIASGKESVTADIALRLARFFGTSAQFWLGLQSDHDLDIARIKLGKKLEKEIVPLAA
ncbi:MAG: HigA family addiction module antidote protein [Acidobacteria bacterium]|nr:HigA family addiction module antidote protein [Acidobacteriota bacterium]